MLRLALKLGDEHIDSKKRKIKVIIATQVLSTTLRRNMFFCNEQKLLPNCLGTSIALLFFRNRHSGATTTSTLFTR